MSDFENLFAEIEQFNNLRANFKGEIGESAFAQFAVQFLDDCYHIGNNVVLKAPNGTTQIDQIIVSKFGIFVIEIKTYSGWIWGSPQNAQWTQTLKTGKYRFQNPLRQNYKHIKVLQNLLNYPDSFFKSLIVFSGDVEFMTQMPDNVVKGGIEYINFIKKRQTVLLSEADIKIIIQKVTDNRLTNEEHLAHIEKIKLQYSNADENNPPQCPRCSNKMVLRTAKSGSNAGNKFWGCCRYPHCKAIINIKNDSEETIRQIKEIQKVLRIVGIW